MGITTNDLKGLIKKDLKNEIINKVSAESVVMQLANIKQMTAPTQEYPVRLETAGTYWVGEAEKITTTSATWETIELAAKKIGGICVLSRESISDGIINAKEEIVEQLANDIVAKLDNACLFGAGSPYGVGKSIFEKSLKHTATGQISEDISNAMALLEDNDVDVQAFVATNALKQKLRGAKDATGAYIFADKTTAQPAMIHGEPLVYTKHFDKTKAELLAGDWSKVYLGLLDDLNFEVLTEATVDGVNLAETDQIAIKCTARMGFLVVNDKAFSSIVPVAAVSKKK